MPLVLKHTTPGSVELQDQPNPVPGDGQLLVKVNIAGGNPVDFELNRSCPPLNSTVGYDFAGTVAKVGPNNSRFSLNDRVAGYTFGGSSYNLTWGAFGEYCIAFDYMTFHIPDGMSDEDAATLPVGLNVAGLSLVKSLKLKAGEPLVVLGGATNMGSVTIQVAKEIGAKPIVASVGKKSIDYVKGLGVDAVVDYTLDEDDYVAQCRSGAPEVKKVMDARSYGSTFRIAGKITGTGGSVCALNPPENTPLPEGVEYDFVNSFQSFGVPFNIFGQDIPADPETTEFLKKWYPSVAEKLVAEGKVKPHGSQVIEGGLLGVLKGWELYKNGAVSAVKLLYRVAETEGITA